MTEANFRLLQPRMRTLIVCVNAEPKCYEGVGWHGIGEGEGNWSNENTGIIETGFKSETWVEVRISICYDGCSMVVEIQHDNSEA